MEKLGNDFFKTEPVTLNENVFKLIVYISMTAGLKDC